MSVKELAREATADFAEWMSRDSCRHLGLTEMRSLQQYIERALLKYGEMVREECAVLAYETVQRDCYIRETGTAKMVAAEIRARKPAECSGIDSCVCHLGHVCGYSCGNKTRHHKGCTHDKPADTEEGE